MELLLAALPGVITTCLLVWVLVRVLDRQNDERQAHREQIVQLSVAHRAEVADLCQRLQAPQLAVATHAAQDALPDPPALDLENDVELIRERQVQLDQLARELEGAM